MNSDFCVAVHALVYLEHKNCVLSSEELADNICTNPVRVRKIMSRLKKAGMVQTREGTEGGYRFEGDAAKLSLAAVAEAMEVCFVSTNWHSGSIDKPCLVSSGMGAIMDDIFAELDEACRKKIQKITIWDIEEKIFGERK